MNATRNQTQLWYCDIYDKTIDNINKSKHIKCESHIRKKEYGTVVKDYVFIGPETDEVNYLLNDTIKDF